MFAASAAMQIGGALFKSSTDTSNYNAKIRAANEEADAINKSTVFNYAHDSLQQQQVQNQEVVQEGQDRTKLTGATGEAAAAAVGGGVTGNSVAELMRGFAVATGTDIANLRGAAKGQLGQAQADKQGQQMSAKNQILGIKEGLPQDPSTAIVGNYVSAALGVGKDFMANTTLITDKNLRTGGLFGAGGFLGTGRQFG